MTMPEVLDRAVPGWAAVEQLRRDPDGNWTVDVLDLQGRVVRVWYSTGRWTPGTWTTKPVWIEESWRTEVVSA